MPQARANYTDPDLRDRIKRKLHRSDKGGRPGQWSARKSQLLAAEYKRRGGGYRGDRTRSARDLDAWTDQQWQTRDGSARARRGGATSRYLPRGAWQKLSADEKRRTEDRKRRGSRSGHQHIPNAPAARQAGSNQRERSQTLEDMTKAALYERAKRLEIPGRSTMDKRSLLRAVRRAE